MARATYEDALARLLVHEGGYSNHPSDPGGPTNFGITIADYRRYCKPGAVAADVRAMRLDEAKAIYRSKYWDALRCDELPAGLDYAVFDYGVNSGVGRAAKVLRVLVAQASDGSIGGAVLEAVRRRPAAELIALLCDERLAFLKRLSTWPVFGAGWGRRVAEVRAAALAMAARAQAKPLPQPASLPGKAATGAIVIAGGAAAQQAHQAGARLAVVAVIVIVTVAVGGWLAWRWHGLRQNPIKGD